MHKHTLAESLAARAERDAAGGDRGSHAAAHKAPTSDARSGCGTARGITGVSPPDVTRGACARFRWEPRFRLRRPALLPRRRIPPAPHARSQVAGRPPLPPARGVVQRKGGPGGREGAGGPVAGLRLDGGTGAARSVVAPGPGPGDSPCVGGPGAGASRCSPPFATGTQLVSPPLACGLEMKRE